MSLYKTNKGFTLIEVLVATSVFLLFALGVYGGLQLVFRIVYQSRIRILETSILSSQLEVAHNMPFENIGIVGGVPAGLLPHNSTTTRNGVDFDIVTTVRNIDDPFDGTLGGSPNDLSPADFKLVEMSIICSKCLNQQTPVVLNTIISPKNLEGDSNNGALFVHVFGADGLAVPGANVHIVNADQNPDLVIDDTTDSDGMLRIVDTPTGTLAYNITVSKSGYSSDQTIVSSESNPNPLRPPANVAKQTVTEISFAIDRSSNINISTLNSSCAPVANAPFKLFGSKILGTDPNVYKYSQNLTSDSSGIKNLTGMEWDKYNLDFSSSNYEVAGTSPMTPLDLAPGATQDYSIILKPHVSDSLLVKVVDAGTELPLSGAMVKLSDGSYDKTLPTGFGYVRQTSWSGGSGQLNYTVENKYFSDSGTINDASGDLKLKKSGQHYLTSGWLLSSIIDIGSAVNFGSIIWSPVNQLEECGPDSLSLQVAGSDSADPASWDYLGPDGMPTSYYTVSNDALWSGLSGKRYIRYKVFLNTANDDCSPLLSELLFTFTNGCTPPGQVFFNDSDSGTFNLEVSREGYSTNSGPIDILGNTDILVRLSPGI